MFAHPSEPEAGRLPAALSAAVPTGGQFLELGAGTAWILHGLSSDISLAS